MSGVETYGGCCPICLKSMFQKWESSGEGLIYDACSWCGFVYDNSDNELTEKDKTSFWKTLSEIYGVIDREEMCRKVAITEYTPPDNTEFFPSIFNYVDKKGAHLIYKILHYINSYKNKSGFSLDGLPVYRKDDTRTKGILLGYKEGKVEIDWEDIDGTSFTQEIDATEVGRTIILSSKPSLKNMMNQAKAPF